MGLFYSQIFRQSLFIKIQLKCHYNCPPQHRNYRYMPLHSSYVTSGIQNQALTPSPVKGHFHDLLFFSPRTLPFGDPKGCFISVNVSFQKSHSLIFYQRQTLLSQIFIVMTLTFEVSAAYVLGLEFFSM